MNTHAGFRTALFALLAAMAAGARADDVPLAQIDALTQAVDALELQHTAGAPPVQLYVGSDDDMLLLRRVSVRIGDAPAYEYEYSAAESQALRSHGLHRLPLRPDGAQAHRVRVQLVARGVDARWDAPRIVATLDETLAPSAQTPVVELALATTGLRRSAVVRMTSAASADALQARATAFDVATPGATALAPAPAPDASVDVVTRYNAALAALQTGEGADGESLLDALGRADADGALALTMRDLANVTLGYARLRARRGTEAIEAFRRVRSPGPYGNPALLGLGWAYVLPHGAAATDTGSPWPQFEPDSPELRRRMPFRYASAVAGGVRAEDVEAALVPWNELNGRDPLDPAVQEGMLAVAYALHHIGAHAQAERHYRRAVERLQAAVSQLDDALAQLRDGRLPAALDAQTPDGWRRWLADLPYDDVTAYVRWLCESAEFLRAYETRRAWHEARIASASLARRLDDLSADDAQARALRVRLDALEAGIAGSLRDADETLATVAADVLRARRDDTLGYLAEARFALARLNDPPPEVASAGQR